MKITWLGHSCFLVEDSNGRKLLTDPFDETIGYNTYKGTVDIITISHHHFDHDYIKDLSGYASIDKVGFFNLCDVPIRGLPSYHDKFKGAKRGENTIFVFEMDGFKLCHLGDLGHVLDKDTIDQIGDIDILFIPVGGNYTINSSEATEIAKSINSHIIIPMHYKTPVINLPIDGLDGFLVEMKNCEKINSNTIVIEKPLCGYNCIKILKHPFN